MVQSYFNFALMLCSLQKLIVHFPHAIKLPCLLGFYSAKMASYGADYSRVRNSEYYLTLYTCVYTDTELDSSLYISTPYIYQSFISRKVGAHLYSTHFMSYFLSNSSILSCK